ncbi:sensor domain-containing diguanylate cyclase [Pelorhabdus rhamnosifermentans]|uniref:sensor domain-containing diguanylate cyclase n=1 Tax=Pelorhabdus rhamnosifermentans TaxID=2772457 RepID=UPI001C0600B5|nr:diguanylate cyclase [Pelorhabdus rhamnosifermentans]
MNKQMRFLHKTTMNIMNHLDFDELIHALVCQAAQLVLASAGFIYLIDSTKQIVHCTVVEGENQKITYYPLPTDEGVIREVLKSGKPLVTDDYSQYAQPLADPLLNQLKTFVVVPIYSAKEIIGTIGVIYDKVQAVSTEKLELLSVLADLTAVAIDNARLYAHAQEELKARIQREKELMTSEEKYRLVFHNVNDAICFADVQTLQFIEVNQQFLDLFGYSQAEISKRILLELAAETEQVLQIMEAAQNGKQIHIDEQWYKRQDGTAFLAEVHVNTFWWHDKLVLCAVFRDITDRKLHEDQIAYLAYHDVLTGLPNRRLVEDRLEKAIAQAKRSKQLLGVLFLDFDGMKPINDAHGHAAGDKFLKDMADKLVQYTRDGDTVARLGGDEFVVVLSELDRKEDANEISQRLIEQCQENFELDGDNFVVSVSIGVSFYPEHAKDGKTLIKYADRAMYQAKRLGGKRFCIYEA